VESVNGASLGCVQVDDVFYAENLWALSAEEISTDCYDDVDCASITSIREYPTNKSLLKTIDILGRETTNKGFQLHIYDDGSVEKKYVIK